MTVNFLRIHKRLPEGVDLHELGMIDVKGDFALVSNLVDPVSPGAALHCDLYIIRKYDENLQKIKWSSWHIKRYKYKGDKEFATWENQLKYSRESHFQYRISSKEAGGFITIGLVLDGEEEGDQIAVLEVTYKVNQVSQLYIKYVNGIQYPYENVDRQMSLSLAGYVPFSFRLINVYWDIIYDAVNEINDARITYLLVASFVYVMEKHWRIIKHYLPKYVCEEVKEYNEKENKIISDDSIKFLLRMQYPKSRINMAVKLLYDICNKYDETHSLEEFEIAELISADFLNSQLDWEANLNNNQNIMINNIYHSFTNEVLVAIKIPILRIFFSNIKNINDIQIYKVAREYYKDEVAAPIVPVDQLDITGTWVLEVTDIEYSITIILSQACDTAVGWMYVRQNIGTREIPDLIFNYSCLKLAKTDEMLSEIEFGGVRYKINGSPTTANERHRLVYNFEGLDISSNRIELHYSKNGEDEILDINFHEDNVEDEILDINFHEDNVDILRFKRVNLSTKPSNDIIFTINHPITRDAIFSAYNFPLDNKQEAYLETSSVAIRDKIVYYKNTNDSYKVNIVTELNNDIRAISSNFTREQIKNVKGYLVNKLYSIKIDGRACWDWLLMISVNQNYREHFSDARSILDLTTDRSTGHYKYVANFQMTGLSYKGNGYGGGRFSFTLNIKRINLDEENREDWSSTYQGSLVEAGVGAGVTITKSMITMECESSLAYIKEDFEGSIVGSQGFTVSLDVFGTITLNWELIPSVFRFNCDRNSNVPPISLIGTPFSLSIGMPDKKVLKRITPFGGSASMDIVYGGLWLSGSKYVNEVSPNIEQLQQEVNFISADSIFFKTNEADIKDDAILNVPGKQAIHYICAKYRRLFEDGSTLLHIEGSASRTGPEEHNLKLSYLRALNVLNEIYACLGDKMKIPENQITIFAYGERLAQEHEGDENNNSQIWRQVRIRIESSTVLSV